MLIIGILNLLILIFIALNATCTLNFLIKITGDISSIQDYCSKEHAKVVAEEMKKRGYIITEAGKELLRANTGK
jgi:hypothetical protein